MLMILIAVMIAGAAMGLSLALFAWDCRRSARRGIRHDLEPIDGPPYYRSITVIDGRDAYFRVSDPAPLAGCLISSEVREPASREASCRTETIR